VKILLTIFTIHLSLFTFGQYVSNVWVADNGDGTYKNPIIHADYSDPDAIRVGDDYYMISSSFNHVPGLPILHSKDLVNWELIGHALQELIPVDHYRKVQHGNGVWAPAIRYHNNEFYIYYPDPDFGIYLIKAKKITGPWSKPIMVEAGRGLIDPCPLWDDDGKVYLVHAFANSRAGIKSILVVKELNAEGTHVIKDSVRVFDGHVTDPTVEGPKFYKRNGYYYIFAPAGGVPTGWQLVLRSKNVYGPYERKVVMDQGKTPVNGPHQGAWVTTQTGEDWFLHFQDKEAYGRIVHLQPMKWVNDWPVIGIDKDKDGKGEPVLIYKKPNVGRTYPKQTPVESDEFNSDKIGLQWQWQANPKDNWAETNSKKGVLRMNCISLPDSLNNLWKAPNLLMQKFPADSFMVTARIQLHFNSDNEAVGLIVFGTDLAFVTIQRSDLYNGYGYRITKNADKGNSGNLIEGNFLKKDSIVYLRVRVEEGAVCNFSASTDGKLFIEMSQPFTAKPGRWVGAKLGLFCISTDAVNKGGYAEVDWFRVEKPARPKKEKGILLTDKNDIK